MANQGGFVAGLEQQYAVFAGTFQGLGDALRTETDLTDEQIKKLQWEEFGEQARGLADAYIRLGLEVPPVIQALLDYGDALEDTSEATTAATEGVDQYSDSILRLIERYGLVGHAADVFGQAMQSGGGFVQGVKDQALGLVGAMHAFFNDLGENTNLSLVEFDPGGT